jgi:NAD+ diphosphatase
MIQHSINFKQELEGWWCVIANHKVYLPAPTNNIPCGVFSDLAMPFTPPEQVHEIGVFEGVTVYLLQITDQEFSQHETEFFGFRTVLFDQPDKFEFVARAFQVDLFLRTHQFCGQCGEKMTLIDWELATQCKPCNHRCYPRISPCIIVAIRNKEKILLAQGVHHKPGQFSIIAGFVESGETLEQAVHREVGEEVGIKVKNLKYFGSQPWPFPHSLMVGYTAEYDSGELVLCEKEILSADWFTLDSMPSTAPIQSIAGQLIAQTKKMMKLAQ